MSKRTTQNNPPHDPTDPAEWPAWCDNWYWEVEPDERAALEVAEVERITDLHDAPPLNQISDIELSQIAAHGCV